MAGPDADAAVALTSGRGRDGSSVRLVPHQETNIEGVSLPWPSLNSSELDVECKQNLSLPADIVDNLSNGTFEALDEQEINSFYFYEPPMCARNPLQLNADRAEGSFDASVTSRLLSVQKISSCRCCECTHERPLAGVVFKYII
uniref:Uncharacterized protein n=1 Tax=Anopheles farauti TaxID=69004 RepID=A0A182R024_9DIPT